MSAIQRAPPTGSFRKISDARTANNGAAKLIAVALASGIMLKASSRRHCEVACDVLRRTWATGRRVWNTVGPTRHKTKAVNRMKEMNTRVNSTSPTG
jgi:hypothetical protein